MTRKEIEQEYTVVDGRITDPGKFENKLIYAPYFSEWAQEGEVLSYMEDGAGEFVSLIEVTDDDRKEFPELDATTSHILVTETEQGFVYCEELTARQAEKVRQEYASEESDEDADAE